MAIDTTFFADLHQIRSELRTGEDVAEQSQVATNHYVGLDNLVRRALAAGLLAVEEIDPADVRKLRKGDAGISALMRMAREHVPASVPRTLLDRLEHEFHHRRNTIEHRQVLVSLAQTLEFVEAVEALLYALADPNVPEPPAVLFPDSPSIEVLAQHVTTRGQGDAPWLFAHGRAKSEEALAGAEHRIAFWQWSGGEWVWRATWDLGHQYVVTMQRVATRTAAHEEVVVWRRHGESMGIMQYDVVAVDDGELTSLLSREGAGMYLSVVGKAILESAGARQLRFTWDGEAYIGERMIRTLPAALGTQRLVFRATHSGQVVGPESLQLRLGDCLLLVRDDLESTIVRTLYTADGVIERLDHDRYVAVGPGRTTVTLIPDVYDWEQALVVEILVEDSSPTFL